MGHSKAFVLETLRPNLPVTWGQRQPNKYRHFLRLTVGVKFINRIQHGAVFMKIFVQFLITRVRLYVFANYSKGLGRFYCTRRRGKMPPKKKEEEKPTPLMGRIGTSLKCGIVGLPNVGCVFWMVFCVSIVLSVANHVDMET